MLFTLAVAWFDDFLKMEAMLKLAGKSMFFVLIDSCLTAL